MTNQEAIEKIEYYLNLAHKSTVSTFTWAEINEEDTITHSKSALDFLEALETITKLLKGPDWVDAGIKKPEPYIEVWGYDQDNKMQTYYYNEKNWFNGGGIYYPISWVKYWKPITVPEKPSIISMPKVKMYKSGEQVDISNATGPVEIKMFNNLGKILGTLDVSSLPQVNNKIRLPDWNCSFLVMYNRDVLGELSIRRDMKKE